MDNQNYHEQLMKKNIIRLREFTQNLPEFCQEYFLGTAQTISSRTQLAYAFDLKVFFEYIHQYKKGYTDIEISDYKLTLLDDITRKDILHTFHYDNISLKITFSTYFAALSVIFSDFL